MSRSSHAVVRVGLSALLVHAAALFFGAGACTTSQGAVPPVEVRVATPAAGPSASAAAVESPTAHACDNDAAEPYDCSKLNLGECGAAVYYACPGVSKLPAGAGFRPKVAARIASCLARPDFDGTDIHRCVDATEACVREAVESSCTDDEAVATCEIELAGCGSDLRLLCAKLLTSLGPEKRKNALEDLRSQRALEAGQPSCEFTWDLNGFPFCPFCPFGGEGRTR